MCTSTNWRSISLKILVSSGGELSSRPRKSFMPSIAAIDSKNCPPFITAGEKIPGENLLPAWPLPQDFLGGIIAGKAGDAAAGMGAGTAEKKIFDGCPIARPTGNRAHEKDLIERHFGVIKISLADTVFRFEVKRRENLAVQNGSFESRRVFFDGIDPGVTQSVALLLPIAVAQMIGRRLHPDRHDVFAGRRQGRVGDRGKGDFQKRLAREAPVLGVVRGALQVIDGRANVDDPAQRCGVVV